MSRQSLKPDTALISTTVELDEVFDDDVYFGFTAGTGGRFNAHDILRWQLDLAGSGADPAIAAPSPDK